MRRVTCYLIIVLLLMIIKLMYMFICFFLLELGTNPLKSAGIENGAFQGMKKLSYIRISDTNITSIPKGKVIALENTHIETK